MGDVGGSHLELRAQPLNAVGQVTEGAVEADIAFTNEADILTLTEVGQDLACCTIPGLLKGFVVLNVGKV